MDIRSKADVGILTFHCADNYGAMLQAYGLKQFLCTHGIKADIVPYEPPYMTGRHWWIPYIPLGDKSKWIRLARSGWRSHRQMKDNFFELRKNMRNFRENHLISQDQRKLFFPNQLKKLSYQMYIVGSDQIWNPDITCGLRKEYFGAFKNGNKKKVISYAASLGGEKLSDKYDDRFSQLIKNVDAVSVREEAVIPYINRFYRKKVTAVLDPVFLLKKEDWEKVEKLPDKKGYILVHMTERTWEIVNYTKKLSEDTHLPVIELRTNMGGITEESFSIVYTAGPAEFLGYIHKADYIVTNSFHMTAFSIIYQKQFTVFLHRSLGERISNILRLHGLESRLYGKAGDKIDSVDWDEVKKRTEENIKASENYLMKHLLELRVEKNDCCGCGSCAAVCHTGAVRMLWDDEGFRYPYIDRNMCVHCNQCEQVCPWENEGGNSSEDFYFGAQAKDERIRYSSSSGGVFQILAQSVLKRQGIVYGAGYDEHMGVMHQEISSKDRLDRITKTNAVSGT